MPIARVKNRKRPKNPGNRQVEADRAAAQSRWLTHGDAASHEEKLNLAKYVEEQNALKAKVKGAKADAKAARTAPTVEADEDSAEG